MALLSGARNERNFHLSQKIYDRMKKLFRQSTNPLISAAVLLANAYATSGDIDKASNVRIQLNKYGAKKQVALSSRTVVNGKFFVSVTQSLQRQLQWIFFRNFELMIDLIVNHLKFMLNSRRYRKSLSHMDMNLIGVGWRDPSVTMKRLRLFFVGIVKNLQSPGIFLKIQMQNEFK